PAIDHLVHRCLEKTLGERWANRRRRLSRGRSADDGGFGEDFYIARTWRGASPVCNARRGFRNPYRTSYAVTPDGQRVLINSIADNAPPPSITVIVNWQGLLKR